MGKLTVLSTTNSSVDLGERLVTCWTPDQRIPAETAAKLPSAITEAEEAVRPVDAKTLAVLLAQSLKVWKLPEDWDDIAPFYREAFEDVPLDLVQAALKHCRMTIKWFPKVSELRAPIDAELRRRRDVLRRLRTMELKAARGDVEEPALRVVPTPEEKAAAEEIAIKTKLMLASLEIKRVPADEPEDEATAERKSRRRGLYAEAYAAFRKTHEQGPPMPPNAGVPS